MWERSQENEWGTFGHCLGMEGWLYLIFSFSFATFAGVLWLIMSSKERFDQLEEKLKTSINARSYSLV
jgi:hypothetical protein